MKRNRRKTETPVRYTPLPEEGLSSAEVAERVDEGWTNYVKKSTTKPLWRIFTDNICTYFNLIWAILIAVVVYLGEYGKLTFVLVVFANTALAVIMEWRAKHTLDKLNLVTSPQIKTVRDGALCSVAAEDLVLDDVVQLKAGDLIPADAVILRGRVELDESMLTGESDAVKKKKGDTIFGGSYIISGGCTARLDRVGADSYIQSIARRVRVFKTPTSFLFRDINRIIKWIGIFIIPFSVVMFINNYMNEQGNLHVALLSTVGSIQGMIPAGMFLLITVAFSLGVVKLYRHGARVADTYSIEMLARTDTLCLDKTGTITDGTMRVVREVGLDRLGDAENADLVASLMAAQDSQNFTSDALNRYYTVKTPLTVLHNIPFSSKRKFTATVFEGIGTVAIGAPEFLSVGRLPAALTAQIDGFAADGQRVLMLAGSPNTTDTEVLPEEMRPLALIVLEDHIRPEAPDTIAWFRENGVSIKIISGDNPITVSAIARRVGVEDAERYVSLDGKTPEEAAELAEEYTVFGRVTPDQKLAIVRRLRENGHVVSMTGDGINDTMALKEADCSIAMASGSSVAIGLSSIVLMDNNFATLPAVVREGRQVVNNVQRSSSLFLMKTFFTITFSLFCICTMQTYPFDPNSLLMFELFVTGFPSVLLALQPNSKPIEGRFVSTVLKQCIPDGLVILANVSVAFLISIFFSFSRGDQLTLLTLVLTLTGFLNLLFLCFPLNRFRFACILLSSIGIFGMIVLDYFFLQPLQTTTFTLTFGISALHSLPVIFLFLLHIAACIPLRIVMQIFYLWIVKKGKQRAARIAEKQQAQAQ